MYISKDDLEEEYIRRDDAEVHVHDGDGSIYLRVDRPTELLK
jgi:hypothetical protein